MELGSSVEHMNFEILYVSVPVNDQLFELEP